MPTTFVNGGELAADIASSDLVSAATARVTVLDPPSSGGIESGAATFQVYSSSPVPTLTDIVPNPVPLQVPVDPGSPASIVVILTGTNFVAGSMAEWNGSTLPTTVLSNSQLQATVAATLMQVGSAQVAVLNPTPGGGTSNVLNVSIVNPIPLLSSVPRFIGAGAPAFTLRVFGNNFTPQSLRHRMSPLCGHANSAEEMRRAVTVVPPHDVVPVGCRI